MVIKGTLCGAISKRPQIFSAECSAHTPENKERCSGQKYGGNRSFCSVSCSISKSTPLSRHVVANAAPSLRRQTHQHVTLSATFTLAKTSAAIRTNYVSGNTNTTLHVVPRAKQKSLQGHFLNPMRPGMLALLHYQIYVSALKTFQMQQLIRSTNSYPHQEEGITKNREENLSNLVIILNIFFIREQHTCWNCSMKWSEHVDKYISAFHRINPSSLRASYESTERQVESVILLLCCRQLKVMKVDILHVVAHSSKHTRTN